MAKFLAIDWDETECRYAVAALQNEKVVIRDLGIMPVDSDEFDSPLAALATATYTFSKEEKIGSCPLLVSLGRHEVEWHQQKLPPCKEAEIPLLLKHQVLREIAGSTEADPLDYLILESSSEGHRVLALMISQVFRKSLLRTFRSMGYPPTHIGFRAGNAAELVLHNPALLDGEVSTPRLVVNIVENDVDLIIIAEERIVAIRSFRLPAEHQQKSLADEIERTLTIGLEGDDPVPIQHVVMFGDGTETGLSKHIKKSGLSVQFLNPLTLPNVSASKSVNDPEKFAPLIGSLLVQSQKIKPVIDFLHPKEAPKPPNYTRPALFALALLVVVCVGLFIWNQSVIRNMEKKLASVKEEYQQVDTELTQLTQSWNVLVQTWTWESQNVVWLDVLRDLSTVMPSSTDLVVDKMTLMTGQPNNAQATGTITLSGMVREPAVLVKLQSDLNASQRYGMLPPVYSSNPAGGGYPWHFQATVYRWRR
ncbi:MAG: hypothetical protein LBI05_05860 [Planctomycetaceae bacterium]|nr:hypothetical protein [Planctomycetaceae bacterium]